MTMYICAEYDCYVIINGRNQMYRAGEWWSIATDFSEREILQIMPMNNSRDCVLFGYSINIRDGEIVSNEYVSRIDMMNHQVYILRKCSINKTPFVRSVNIKNKQYTAQTHTGNDDMTIEVDGESVYRCELMSVCKNMHISSRKVSDKTYIILQLLCRNEKYIYMANTDSIETPIISSFGNIVSISDEEITIVRHYNDHYAHARIEIYSIIDGEWRNRERYTAYTESPPNDNLADEYIAAVYMDCIMAGNHKYASHLLTEELAQVLTEDSVEAFFGEIDSISYYHPYIITYKKYAPNGAYLFIIDNGKISNISSIM